MTIQQVTIFILLMLASSLASFAQEVYCGCPELDYFMRGVKIEHNCPFVSPTRTEIWELCGSFQPPLVMHGSCCGFFKPCYPKEVSDTLRPSGNRCIFERYWLNNGCDILTLSCRYTSEQYFKMSCAPCQQEVGGGSPPPPLIPTYDPIGSPILLPLDNRGLRLTSIENGVYFDLNGDGLPERLAWTDARIFQGFLALDRNQNGMIDNGIELFGNFTPQPPSTTPNGFEALLVFDDNGDRVIDPRDPIYEELLVWIDSNHDGMSTSEELQTLTTLGVLSIDLRYRESRRKDRYGNEFRYRSKITYQSKKRRFAWDVFLRMEPVL